MYIDGQEDRLCEKLARRTGFWFTTHLGIKYFLTDPHPNDVKIEDIAWALSNVARFGGHAKVHYSVGQHSEYCRQMAKQMYGTDFLLQMHLLLHDASEAYIGDVVRPLKVTQPDYLALEEKTMSVIYEALKLPEPDAQQLKIIKYIDNAVLLAEARDLITGGGKDWDMVSGIPWKERIVPMTPRTVNFNFLNSFFWLESQLVGLGIVS